MERISIRLQGSESVSALLCVPAPAQACLVFAHGAGAGMEHGFMTSMAQALAARQVATLRYQFPYMERGSKRPDPPRIAHATVRAAVVEAGLRVATLPLFAGGKSFGGRMTSQAQAEAPLDGVRGLVFVGFPLHPAGKPSRERAAHLLEVACPMLFLQGTRDELAELPLLREAVAPLGDRATVRVIDDADHSFHVRARSGQTDEQVRATLADAMVNWFGTASASDEVASNRR